MSILVQFVNSFDVPDFWPRIADRLAKPIKKSGNELTLEYVLTGISLGKLNLWLCREGEAIKSVAVTETHWSPSGVRSLNILLFEGTDVDACLDELLPVLREFGRAKHCKKLLFTGRPGWKDRARRHGMRVGAVQFEQTL